MSFLLRRSGDGYYVTAPGSVHSYTRAIQCARQWPTREAAQGDACGNECVVSLHDEVEAGFRGILAGRKC